MMNTTLKSVAREPLLHFLIMGALLFIVAGYFSPSTERDDVTTITVTAQRVEQIHNKLQGIFKRSPTNAELKAAIDAYITEEVLLLEGLKLGVVEEDPLIRMRVAERVTFLLSDTTPAKTPTDAQLHEFVQTNPALFTQPIRRSFTHIYFNPAKHPTNMTTVITNAQKNIAAHTQAVLSTADIFTDGNDYQQVDAAFIATTFGANFANKVFSAPLKTWQGPFESTHGIHFVFIKEEIPAEQPAFDAIREHALKLYLEKQRKKINDETIAQLKAQYRITIEPTPVP